MHAINWENEIQLALSHGQWIWAIILVAASGFLTSLSPCVYPLIPITLSTMGARQYQSHIHGFLVAFIYVLGMGLLYIALGVTFAWLGVILGATLQSPWMMGFLAFFLLLMALSMFGVFEIVLPQFLVNHIVRIGGRGYRGAFAMGLVAGIIAAPCTGPVLSFVLTIIATKKDIVQGVILMSSYTLGMGIPFLFLGTFSSMISRIPKSGKWMNTIKITLGVAMLVASLYYAQFAFPGVKQVWQFFVSGTGMHQQNSAWQVIGNQPDAAVKLKNMLNQAKAEKKPVLIDFYADWCGACRDLDRITYADSEVKKLLNHFMLIKIDATNSSSDIYGIQEQFTIVGLPTVVFINSEGAQLKTRINGFLSPSDMEIVLHQILRN